MLRLNIKLTGKIEDGLQGSAGRHRSSDQMGVLNSQPSGQSTGVRSPIYDPFRIGNVVHVVNALDKSGRVL